LPAQSGPVWPSLAQSGPVWPSLACGINACDGLRLSYIRPINDPARTIVRLNHSLELISVVSCRIQSLNASAATTYSTRAPPDGAPEMAHSGIAHAASSDALETYTTSSSNGHDHAVRCLHRGNWHGLNCRS